MGIMAGGDGGGAIPPEGPNEMNEQEVRCAQHGEEIKTLRERTQKLTADVAARQAEMFELRADLHSMVQKIPDTLRDQLITLAVKLDNAIADIEEVKELVRGELVTRTEFEPVKKVVYGVVGVILLAVMSALVGLVILKGK